MFDSGRALGWGVPTFVKPYVMLPVKQVLARLDGPVIGPRWEVFALNEECRENRNAPASYGESSFIAVEVGQQSLTAPSAGVSSELGEPTEHAGRWASAKLLGGQGHGL